MEISLTKKQMQFVSSDCDEVLFGGAAGGGKSYAQVVDALLYALKYPNSRQIIFRRTLVELERSIVLKCREIFESSVYDYKASAKKFVFKNGSEIELGYCERESDVYKYQSAEYDVVRFDELTHFQMSIYIYMISRIRGTNGYPKQIKSTTNPGGIGHGWVKKRFIDRAVLGGSFMDNGRSYEFIPAKIYDNVFLCQSDSGYTDRLKLLPEIERRALLDGDWNIFKGQFFSEFSNEYNIIKPFKIPDNWRRFRSIDYGLDMTACLWWALDELDNVYIYRELCKENLTLSAAAIEIIKKSGDEKYMYTVASPDLWSRRQESGVSGADIMQNAGLLGLVKANNERISGWRMVRELLSLRTDEFGDKGARLKIFDNVCVKLVSSIVQLCFDEKNCEDAAVFPHDITHCPDSLRYGAMSLPLKIKKHEDIVDEFNLFQNGEENDYRNFIEYEE